MSFVIFTEDTSDLPEDYVRNNNIKVVRIPCYINDEVCAVEPSRFYELMRSGILPTTSLVNATTFVELFEPYLRNGDKILYIGFSSALSGTYEEGEKARKMLEAMYPNQLFVLDSKCASMGEGLLVDIAVTLRATGLDIEEVYKQLQQRINKVCHYFTVDNLFHLYRGGRVSKTKATLGTLLQLKPILHVDNEGRLIPLTNVGGRKKSLKVLVDKMVEKCNGVAPTKVFISHGDCWDDARFVADLVKLRLGVEDITMSYIGSVVGAHAGPNTVAVFFEISEGVR